MSHDAYLQAQKQTANPRDTEYRAFTKATRALIEASASGHSDLKTLIKAVDLNRQLWGALASDCANPMNELPKDTRAQIIGLSRWVSSYSGEVMRAKESLDPLIDVNRIMMDGLTGKTAEA